jgi:hypothetical protein
VPSMDRTRRPARSPDLNPLDFWLWEFLKTSAYSEPIGDLRGITASSVEFLLGDSSETVNFLNITHFFETKS